MFFLKNDILTKYSGTIFMLHSSFGILTFIVMFIRIGLSHSLAKRNKHLQIDQGKLLNLVVKIVHNGLYAIFFIVPILGLTKVYMAAAPFKFFGLEIANNHFEYYQYEHLIKELHGTLAIVGLVLIAMHAGAAILHHYYHKDNTLHSMLPIVKSPKK